MLLMSIPDYQSIMLPLLRYADDADEHSVREAIEHLASHFNLTEMDRKKLLPSGQERTFDNRVWWARTYLGKAGLLGSTRRGFFQITPRGKSLLQTNPERIDVKVLSQFEE